MDANTLLLNEFISPWITIGLSFTLGLILKDVIATIVQGFLFRVSRDFNEGDEVLLNDEDAMIVSIGWKYTRFAIFKKDEIIAWRYVPNDQIRYLKIEKIMRHSDQERWFDSRNPNGKYRLSTKLEKEVNNA